MRVLLHGLVVLVVECHRRREGWVVRGVELIHSPTCDRALRLEDVAIFCGTKTLSGDPLRQNL